MLDAFFLCSLPFLKLPARCLDNAILTTFSFGLCDDSIFLISMLPPRVCAFLSYLASSFSIPTYLRLCMYKPILKMFQGSMWTGQGWASWIWDGFSTGPTLWVELCVLSRLGSGLQPSLTSLFFLFASRSTFFSHRIVPFRCNIRISPRINQMSLLEMADGNVVMKYEMRSCFTCGTKVEIEGDCDAYMCSHEVELRRMLYDGNRILTRVTSALRQGCRAVTQPLIN